MKPKTMVAVKPEVPRSSVLVNNPNGRTVIANGSDVMRCKRKLGYIAGQQQTYPSQPASVARRNARERNRVKQVNNGFATLRSHIPASVAAAICTEKPSSRNSVASKKLSKVETLKMAVEYIRSLQQLLEDHGGALTSSKVYEDDDVRYYSSSPETVVSGETHYYPNSPEGYTKSEPSESGYYSPTRTYKTENYPQFNAEMHESLTAEFANARSPEPPEAHAHSFVQPRLRGSTSLSPPMSDAPSPTPSYASDNSGLHPGSTSSGKLVSQMSRMTTAAAPIPAHKRSPSGYENYENISAEDEELLDVISWWQQTSD